MPGMIFEEESSREGREEKEKGKNALPSSPSRSSREIISRRIS
jgi:hypothetical protein